MREPVRRWGFRAAVACFLLLAGYYLVFGGVYSLFDMRDLERERDAVVRRLDSLIVRTDSLAQRGDSLESGRLAIERTAREQHGLIRDGEIVVRFHPVDSTEVVKGEGDEAGESPE